MRVWASAAIAAIGLGVPEVAFAEPVYFYKAGVERAAFVADGAECEALASGVEAPGTPTVYTPNIYAVAAEALFAGFMRAGERRRMIDSVMRTCMLDKGYRRVRAPDRLRREVGKLPEGERIERLFALSAADAPTGEVLPR